MTILSAAIKMFEGEMRRAQFTRNATERYARELERFAAHVGADVPISDVDAAKCRSYLDTFDHHAPATVALEHTILSSLFKFLALDDLIAASPMQKVRRPKVPALRDRKRTRVSTAQVQQMIAACETWPEKMCLNLLAYTGARRHAASEVRWRDVDGKRWTITFQEKGRKRITKPIADDLRKVMTAYAIECGPLDPDDWVIPNRRPTGKSERSDRIVYHLVKTVAARCEINSHVHALRAAFAVHFLRTNPAQLEALRQLMGHSSVSTTQGYLSELEGEDAMRVVESLSFAVDDDLGVAA